jgi:replicative DNA helicase
MPKHISEYLPELEEELASRTERPELSLEMTPALNQIIWGIKKRKLTLIGSRTSHGKSAWALQIAHDLARQGKAVWLLSLEMTVVEILERMFCHTNEIDNEQIMKGHFDRYRSQFDGYKNYCEKLNLVVTDCIGKNWKEVDKIVEGLHNKPEVVIVDYIQNIRGASSNQKTNIDDYILHFREMAIRQNFAGIICSQINRAGQDEKDKQPLLHNLKGSGTLEECPDVIWLLHWERKYDSNFSENEYRINIAKNRGGRTGHVKMLYQPEYYLFKDHTEMEAKRLEAKQETETYGK